MHPPPSTNPHSVCLSRVILSWPYNGVWCITVHVFGLVMLLSRLAQPYSLQISVHSLNLQYPMCWCFLGPDKQPVVLAAYICPYPPFFDRSIAFLIADAYHHWGTRACNTRYWIGSKFYAIPQSKRFAGVSKPATWGTTIYLLMSAFLLRTFVRQEYFFFIVFG